jgi:hypothetical protein
MAAKDPVYMDAVEGEGPLDFLERVYRNPLIDVAERTRAAIVVAQYRNGGEKKSAGGIKEARKTAAGEVSKGGTFAPLAPPKLVASRG